MTKPDKDWYRKIWTLDIKDLSWVESTNAQVDFIIRLLDLRGEPPYSIRLSSELSSHLVIYDALHYHADRDWIPSSLLSE